jgi:hypothetical protein
MMTAAVPATTAMTAAKMSTAVVTAAVATSMTSAVTSTMPAALGDGISGRRQRGRENNDGNSQSEL